MRTQPPPNWVRRRHFILAAAILGFIVTGILVDQPHDHPLMWRKIIFYLALITFLWSLLIYWMVELCYPHIQVDRIYYVSRAEQSGSYMRLYAKIFFTIGGVFALFMSVVGFMVVFTDLPSV
jgi:hypothetical protein